LVARTFLLFGFFLCSGNTQYSSGNINNKIDSPITTECPGIFARLDGGKRVSRERREYLATKLREITGLKNLNFADNGLLQLDNASPSVGSKTARMLLEKGVRGNNIIIIEDVSRRADVIFARVVTNRKAANRSRVYLIQIDFVDFEFLMGDAPALRAFDVGWAFFHELDHIVENSKDSGLDNSVGECESHINLMREECDLPLRADYFHTRLPRPKEIEFISKFVRLPFVHQTGNKQKRYWVMWDAGIVGTLEVHRPTLSLTDAAETITGPDHMRSATTSP
jgi:hypothetical protein